MKRILSCVLLCMGSISGSAWAETIDFENLDSDVAVVNQYPGVTFDRSVILTSGISLVEAEYPPHSGDNVVSSLGGSLSLTFNNPISNFAAYATYSSRLTLSAYDFNGVLLKTRSSLFGTNRQRTGDAGSSPNELLAVDSASGIRSILISSLSTRDFSFVLDDVSFTPVTPVPLPPSLPLLLGGVAWLACTARTKRPSAARYSAAVPA